MSISYTLFLYIPFISMLIFRLPTFIVHYKVVTTNNSPCNRIRHVKLRELCLVCTYETSWKRNMQKRENLDIDPRREKLTLKTGWYSDRWKYSIKIIHPLTMILPLHAIYALVIWIRCTVDITIWLIHCILIAEFIGILFFINIYWGKK